MNAKEERLKLLEESMKKFEEKYNKEIKEYERQKIEEENKIKMMDELNKEYIEKNKKELYEKEEMIKNLENEIKSKENILKEKNDIITKIQNDNKSLEENLKINKEQNKNKMKEKEEILINLEKKLKDEIKNLEEKLKDKEKQLNKEKEEFDKKMKENKEINEKLKSENENCKKDLIEKEKQLTINEKNISKGNITSPKENSIFLPKENDEFLQDLLTDILLKLDFFKYNLNLFDLLNKTLGNYDKLKYFQNSTSNLAESSLDYLYYFYLHIKSYFTVGQNNTSLKDLLSQNSFIFSEQNISDINYDELPEKIKSLNIWRNNNMKEIYEKKKENYFKKIESIFDSLKNKMINDILNNITHKNEIRRNHFIKSSEPKTNLEVNFDDLNKQQNLAKFQVFNSFNELKELTLLISNFPLFLSYSLIVRSTNLNSLKIFFITEKSRSKNNENIENLCQTIPVLIKLINKLESFELNNFPIKPNKVPDLVEALKTSKIKKLSLINCFPKKDGVTSLIPYFSYANKALIDINISEYNFNIISYLSNSIFNNQNNKNLISITFSNCKLNEEEIHHISNFIASSTSILSCDISQNILSTKSCSQFGYCMQKTTTLETLKMNECGINGESLPFLFNTKGSKCLKKIYLNSNNFGDIGLVSIGGFMKNSPEMEILEVKRCGGSDMGFMNLTSIIKVLKENKLKYVNYLENDITSMALGSLMQFNEIFKNKGVIFILNKIEGETDKIKLDCAIFK